MVVQLKSLSGPQRYQRPTKIIYENACGPSLCVCELVHCAHEPQLHVSSPPHARQQRDGAQLDGDDARRHGGEQQLSDDAPGTDASVLLPSWSFSLYLGGLGFVRNLDFAPFIEVACWNQTAELALCSMMAGYWPPTCL